MARIRSIKPEFWDDEAVGLLSRDSRLLYIATWNMADDEGLLRWTASYIKANAFMYDDDLGVEAITALMTEVTTAQLVLPYVAGKTRQSLAWVVQFAKHQKPNRPQPSKLPPPSIQNGDVLQAYIRRDRGVCHLCGQEIATGPDSRSSWPSLDHVLPRSQGGSDYPSNLRLSHCGCNKARSDRPVESFATTPTAITRKSAVSKDVSGSVNDSLNGSLNDSLSNPENHDNQADTGTINSLFHSVNDSVNYSLPEGRGLGGERKGGEGVLVPQGGAQTLVAEWIDSCRKRPPEAVVGQVAKLTGQLLSEGIAYSDVRDGLIAWAAKGVHPAVLPSVVNEVMNARPATQMSTTDIRVQQGLALVEHYRQQEGA